MTRSALFLHMALLVWVFLIPGGASAQKYIWEPGMTWGEKPKIEDADLAKVYERLEKAQELSARILIFLIEMDDQLNPPRDLEKELGRRPTDIEIRQAGLESPILERLQIDFRGFFEEAYEDFVWEDATWGGASLLGGVLTISVGRSALRKGRSLIGNVSLGAGAISLVPAAVALTAISSNNSFNGFTDQVQRLELQTLGEVLPRRIAAWDLARIQKMFRLSAEETSIMAEAANNIAFNPSRSGKTQSGFQKMESGDGKPVVRVRLYTLLKAARRKTRFKTNPHGLPTEYHGIKDSRLSAYEKFHMFLSRQDQFRVSHGGLFPFDATLQSWAVEKTGLLGNRAAHRHLSLTVAMLDWLISSLNKESDEDLVERLAVKMRDLEKEGHGEESKKYIEAVEKFKYWSDESEAFRTQVKRERRRLQFLLDNM